jgi:putative transposase
MDASDIKHLKELEEENSRRRRMFADLILEHEALKSIVE